MPICPLSAPSQQRPALNNRFAFCWPNRDQRESLHDGTHSNPSSYSCRPNVHKTNVTALAQQRSSKTWSLHIHSKSETYARKRRKALISPAWSLYAFRTTSSNDVTCISPKYHMPGKEKESIMCDLDLWNEVYYHHFTVSTPTNSDRFISSFRNPCFGTFWQSSLYLHLTLV